MDGIHKYFSDFMKRRHPLISTAIPFLTTLILLIPVQTFPEERMIETSVDGYYPSRIQTRVGDKATWINTDAVDHEIAFSGNPTASQEEDFYLLLPKRNTASLVISKPGIYSYKCSWHGMHGKIEVLPVRSGD